MISIIITTKDQAHSVVGCVRSVLAQKCDEEREIILIDDGSRDGTPDRVKEHFDGQLRIIAKQAGGWLDTIQRGLKESSGDIVVFFDPHCVATNPLWLSNIVKNFRTEPELEIMTGSLFKDSHVMGKVSALALESAFLRQDRHWVDYVEDDNFACRREALQRLICQLPVHEVVGDTAGGLLLGAEIRRQGMRVFYDPEMAVFHESPGFVDFLRRCANYSARTSVMARKLDPSLRGAHWIKRPLLAPFVFGVVKYSQDVRATFRFRRDLHVRVWEIPALLAIAAIGKMWYTWGVWKVIRTDAKRT